MTKSLLKAANNVTIVSIGGQATSASNDVECMTVNKNLSNNESVRSNEVEQRETQIIHAVNNVTIDKRKKPDAQKLIEVSMFLSVALFASFGAFCRILLADVTVHNDDDQQLATIFAPFLLPNMVGTFVMGIFTGSIADLIQKRFNDVSPIIMKGITTGWCGSCTTFATWQVASVKLYLETSKDNLYFIYYSILVSVISFSTSYTALLFGRHISIIGAWCCHADKDPSARKVDPTLSVISKDTWKLQLKSFIVYLSIFSVMQLCLWLSAFLDTSHVRRSWWMVSCVAPYGACVRYWLSLYNKRSYLSFPVYTFVANIVASVLSFVILLILNYYQSTNSPDLQLSAWLSYGIGSGFCGSLSTVSTWINEIYAINNTMPGLKAYKYAIASIVTAQLLCLCIGLPYVIMRNRL